MMCDTSCLSVRPWRETRDVPYLSSGSSKSVFLMPCGDHVFKQQHRSDPKYGHAHLCREILVWQTADAELRQKLAPIDAYNCRVGGWILQRRCEPASKALMDYVLDLEDCDLPMNDDYYRNYGLLDGRIVMLDYGYEDRLSAFRIRQLHKLHSGRTVICRTIDA